MSSLSRIFKTFVRGSTLNSYRTLTSSSISGTNPTVLSPILLSNNPWIWQKQEPLKLPFNIIKPIKLPEEQMYIPPLIEPTNNTVNAIIDDPLNADNEEKQAVRLIVIRRKKMKKHKLKKLRKRMKFEYAKQRQKRELKKEKLFQAGLIAQYKEAETFNAETFVKDKLNQAAYVPPPRRFYKGQHVPDGVNLEEYLSERELANVKYVYYTKQSK